MSEVFADPTELTVAGGPVRVYTGGLGATRPLQLGTWAALHTRPTEWGC